MDYRAHFAIGFILTLVIVYFFIGHDLLTVLPLSIFGGISALVPDLDHESSKGKKILDIVFISAAVFLLYRSKCSNAFCFPSFNMLSEIIVATLALIGAYFLFFRFFKPRHRGITHTIFACILYSITIYLVLGLFFAICAFIGYISHLLADNQIQFM